MDELVLLGYVTKSFGLKGGFCINLFNDDTSLFTKDVSLQLKLKNKKEFKTVLVEDFLKPNRLFLQTVVTKEQADELRGAEIYIESSKLPVLEEDEYYLEEIKDFEVFEENKFIGTVAGFASNGVQTILEVKAKNDHIFLAPLVKPLIKEINFEEEKIIFLEIGLFDPMD